MESEAVVVVAVLLVLALLVWRMAARTSAEASPASKVFRCARCGTQALHTSRTIDVARRGQSRFFCDACHALWLTTRASQPAAGRPSKVKPADGSGCLVVLCVAAALVSGGVVLWIRV
ncbi:MAG: hypothetical protein DI564_06315 [Rhodanobacter denitrificans]|uniref:Uncharacterized protein n=1 Tax=Rhodanobacter denitrificans TaxID=666685 RepID=A0A2W5KNH6_9GAMM|nr:MAG: hypothetical protein DI564_06315 [Rhodanobacter denitrificans]